MDDNTLIPVSDDDKIASLQAGLGRVLKTPSPGPWTLFKPRDWVAVPCESGCHFDPTDQERLASAVTQDVQLYAVALEELGDFPVAFAVPSTAVGINAFSRKTAHFNFSIFPGDMSWIIVCTTDDYFVVAGPEGFVRDVLGGDLERAFSDFDRFASARPWTMTPFLAPVYQSLYDHYRNPNESTFVRF